MKNLIACIICTFFWATAFCQSGISKTPKPGIKKPSFPASQPVVNTWKQGIVPSNKDSVFSFKNAPIVPANYQSTLPQPLTTDGLFDFLILVVHPELTDVKPLVDTR